MNNDVSTAWIRPPEWLADRQSATDHRIGTREEWTVAREELLTREKEHTRLGDELARERRELPWVRVEKEYRLDTDDGPRALAELFDGRSQLLIYHFMFGPTYVAGCPINSSIADSVTDTGLDRDSKAQAEQVRSIAVEGVADRLGVVPHAIMLDIDEALRLHLGL
jgi:hypothetical protein